MFMRWCWLCLRPTCFRFHHPVIHKGQDKGYDLYRCEQCDRMSIMIPRPYFRSMN